MSTKENKKIYGLRVSAIGETLLFLVGLVLADFLFGSGHRFINVFPHPFWIIVLLMSVQYGTYEGLFATLLATFFLYVGNFPEQQVNETTFEYQFHLMVRPFLWLAVTFVLGELSVRMQRNLAEAEVQRDEFSKHALAITGAYEDQKKTKENLETRLAGQLSTVAATYETVRALETLKPGQILTSLEEIVKATLNPRKFSVYAYGDNGLEAAICHGWEGGDSYNRRYSKDHSLFQEVAEKNRMVCLINQEDEAIIASEGVMAAPLIDHDSGVLFGMLKVEEIDLFNLHISNLEIFKTLCELIGSAYANARQYQKVKEKSIYGEDEKINSYLFYQVQKEFLLTLSEKIGKPLSSLSIKLDRPEVFQEFLLELKGVIPIEAQIFEGKRKKTELCVILPGFSEKDAEKLSLSLLNRLQNNEKLKSTHGVFEAAKIYEPSKEGRAVS